MNKSENKILPTIIRAVLIVGLLILIPSLFIGACDYYERRWYEIISDDKMKGKSYSEVMTYVGEPIYRMPSEKKSEICVYSPYHRFGLLGRLISKLRGQPKTAIVFIDNKYWIVVLQLESGEKEGVGLWH